MYDPLGRLFQTTINGTATQFLYDGDALVAEFNGSNVLQRRYVHGDQVDEPWVQYNGINVGTAYRRYLLADHQGSIIAQADGSGNTLNTLAYDSFGIPATKNANAPGAFGYTGQIYLPGVGLNYYKARMYSPKIGRFLQTDPIGYDDDMNMYAYTGNDPINKIDPSGMTQMPIPDSNCDSWCRKNTLSDNWRSYLPNGGSSNNGAPSSSGQSNFGRIMFGPTEINGYPVLQAGVPDARAITLSVARYGIKSYSQLKKITAGTGQEVHHLIEKRFANIFGAKAKNMESIVLTPAQHQAFTNAWRQFPMVRELQMQRKNKL